MPKGSCAGGRTNPEAFQTALDALDVIGRWDWDAVTDRARSDAFVALLFNVDPGEAEAGVPLTAYTAAIHAEDRMRVLDLIRHSAEAGSTFLTEYRVVSADGRTRWVLARGRFVTDHAGRPLRGGGILVDITGLRACEGTVGETGGHSAEAPLERAAEHVIMAQAVIAGLQDPGLKARADALLLELGRRLAEQEVQDRRRRMN